METVKDTVARTKSLEGRGQTNGHLNPAEARAILETEAKERVAECQAEIEKVLDKYQCAIDVVVILKADRVIPQVQIVAK